MTDKSSEIITAALRRAAVEPAGLPVYGSRALFASSASGKKAAQLCKSEGYLQIVKTEHRGRGVREICAITEKGLAYLLLQVSPKQVLEDLVHALHSQQAQVGELLATARHWQANIDAFKTLVDKVMRQGGEIAWNISHVNGKVDAGLSASHDLAGAQVSKAILDHLRTWRESGATGDCPLPELFRRLHSNITIGQFHDQLRALHEQEQIYLHSWSGPLPEIPEPALALLAGHGIAYYASIR